MAGAAKEDFWHGRAAKRFFFFSTAGVVRANVQRGRGCQGKFSEWQRLPGRIFYVAGAARETILHGRGCQAGAYVPHFFLQDLWQFMLVCFVFVINVERHASVTHGKTYTVGSGSQVPGRQGPSASK